MTAPSAPTLVHLHAEVPCSKRTQCLAVGPDARIWAVTAPPDRTVGYAVNRALARVAVEAYEERRIDSVADWPIRWRYDVQFAACEPPLVGHQGADSAIERTRVAAQAAGERNRRARRVQIVTDLFGRGPVQARHHGYPTAMVG